MENNRKSHVGYRRFARGLAGLLLIAILPLAQADEAKPRYIAGEGEDTGDCRNLFRPCRSLNYVLTQAHKGDPILVGEGQYQLRNLDELYALINADIRAGMDKISHYSAQSDAVVSTLTGVPLEYRSSFEDLGFHVIVDRKGKNIAKSQLQSFQQKLQASRNNHASVDCVDGAAAGFACENLNLYAHLNLDSLKDNAVGASDIWGFVDLNTLREYVIVGLSNGVSVVDVSDPENPWVVGTSDGLSSGWRDIKILQTRDENSGRWHAWAYISTEANMGLAILDLGDLPNGFSEVSFTSDFATAHNVYLANTDYSFGVAREGAEPLLTVAGSNLGRGRYRLYALDDPANPRLHISQGAEYMHDAASVQIRDERKDNQCVNAQSSDTCKLLADFNENNLLIYDVSDPDNAARLSSVSYTSAGYVHSGWWSEDGRYLFVHDEFDEIEGLNTTLRAFDVSDLTSPQLIDVWSGPTRAIDHNGFVRGNRYYMSNYVEGLTVLDISDPADPQRVAWFDTEPASSAPVFEGAWGVYPYLASGTLAVSDTNSGLFLLRDNSLASANGSLAFSRAEWSGNEGENLTLEVARLGSSEGAIAVNIVPHYLSATAEDLNIDATSLHWEDGDSAPKTLNLDIHADALSEGDELLVLRLESPSGGASLQQPNLAYVRLGEGATGSVAPLDDEISVEHEHTQILLTLQRRGNAQQSASVDWSLNDTAGLEFTENSGSVSWAAGDAAPKTLRLTPTDKPTGAVSFSLGLHNPVNVVLESESISIAKQAANDSSSNPPASGSSSGGSTPGQPSGSSDGGGSLDLYLLMLLALTLAWRYLAVNLDGK